MTGRGDEKGGEARSAFAGIRVLDLSRVLAGPFCGQMLADFGAEVVKVENLGGDENRSWEPVIDGASANFISVNRGKRGLTLNLKSPEGQALLERLIARSDVVIESFLPATAAHLGLDHERVRSLNERVVHVSITGYGQVGPWANRPGYDLMLQAFTGMMAMTGEPGGLPCRAGASFIDMATGALAFAGVSAALYARAAGRAGGQHVAVSLLETGIALLGYHISGWTMAGKLPERNGSGVWHIVPYQAFRTADGWLLAGATNDAAWQRLCEALDAPDLAADGRFATIASRIAHRDEVVSALSGIFATRGSGEWMARLDAMRVPCSPINDVAQALAHPQVAATEMVVEVPDGDGMRLAGIPLNMSGTPGRPGPRPPGVGEHSGAVLRDWLGLGRDETDRLRAAGAI